MAIHCEVGRYDAIGFSNALGAAMVEDFVDSEVPANHFAAELVIDLHPELFAPLREIYASEALQSALWRSHLYIVIARPQITAQCLESPILGRIVEFSSTAAPGFDAVGFTCTEAVASTNLGAGIPAVHWSRMQVDDSGRRIRLEVDDKLALYLSANVLAALTSTGDPRLFRAVSKWKIAYIGRSYGSGRDSLIKRLRRHEVVQRILDDYLSIGWEVNVVPITVASTYTVFITSDYQGPEIDLNQIQALSSADGDLETAQLVSVIENALISYFQPDYNTLLRRWPSAREGDSFAQAGVASLQTHFDAAGDIYQLFSSDRPLVTRGFSIRSYLRGPRGQEDATESKLANEIEDLRALAAKKQITHADRSAPSIRIFEDQIFAI